MYELRVCVKMSLSVGSCSLNSCFPNIQILNYCTEGTTVYFNFSITFTLCRSWLTFLLLFSSLVSLRCPCLSLLVTHPLVNKIYMYIYNLSTPSLDTSPHNNWISFSTDSIMYLSSCFLCTPACMRWWHSWWLCCPGMCVCCGVGRSLKKGYTMCMAMVANGYLHLHHYPQSYFQWHLS